VTEAAPGCHHRLPEAGYATIIALALQGDSVIIELATFLQSMTAA
jgi:hypothetical protein